MNAEGYIDFAILMSATVAVVFSVGGIVSGVSVGRKEGVRSGIYLASFLILVGIYISVAGLAWNLANVPTETAQTAPDAQGD